MSSRPLATPVATRVLVTLAAFTLAVLVATVMVRDARLGIAFVGALVFVPIAFLTPALALAGWLVSAFLTALPGVGGVANRALLVVFAVWIGTLAAKRADPVALRQRLPQFGLVVVFVAWTVFTLLWAPTTNGTGELVTRLLLAALVYLLVVTLVNEPKHARWLAGAFVVGCVLSILSGVVTGGLDASGAGDTLTSQEGRFQGGAGDPNYLAAAIVPTMMLAAALASRRGHPFVRAALILAIGILAIGLAATESRGGFLAIVVVTLGALVLLRGRRRAIAGMILVFALAAAFWFAISPTAWDRVTGSPDDGSGRTSLWTVAWRVVEAHPVGGVGFNQFSVVAQDYVREPGLLERADMIVDGYVVHNVYLQLWAETGIVGLLLFLAVALRAILAARAAAERFDARGDPETALLARAVMLAVIGALTASFFLSNAVDQWLWVLFGFCVAMQTIARGAPAAGERQEFAR